MQTDTTPILNKKTSTSSPEAEVRQTINEIMDAMRAGDVDKLMTFYSPDIVAFDVSIPLQFKGVDAYKKSWIDAFDMCDPNAESKQEVHELSITASNDIAFAHLIRHDVVQPKEGGKWDMWMRATHCFKKIGNKWLIVHEQFSVPVNFETKEAVFSEGLNSKH